MHKSVDKELIWTPWGWLPPSTRYRSLQGTVEVSEAPRMDRRSSRNIRKYLPRHQKRVTSYPDVIGDDLVFHSPPHPTFARWLISALPRSLRHE